MRRLIGKFINWVMADQRLSVGDLVVNKPNTIYTDSIAEKTTNAGVAVTSLRPNSGTSFPASADSKVGQIFYRSDEKKIYCFIGVGEPGTTSGWFNLKNAQYAA
jgi:hypothetical protein